MNAPALFPAPQHDHQDCVRDALEAAERSCQAHGARLTPIRRRILELVWASHEPVGAYGLLDRLAAEGVKSVPADESIGRWISCSRKAWCIDWSASTPMSAVPTGMARTRRNS